MNNNMDKSASENLEENGEMVNHEGAYLDTHHRNHREIPMPSAPSESPSKAHGHVALSRHAQSVGSCLLYGVCSISMAFLNKVLLNTYKFDFPYTIMVGQMLFTVALLETLNALQFISIPTYSLQRGRTFFLPSLFYAAYSVLALTALSGMNIPMYSVIKRCTPGVNLVIAVCILKKGLPSRKISLAVAMMCIGCLIAGYGDLTFDAWTYLCGAASVLTQAIYLTLVQKFSQGKMSTNETLQLNSYNSIPLLVFCLLANNEMTEVLNYPHLWQPDFIFLYLLLISAGCLLNYSMFLCTSINSALTTSVVGSLKSVLQTAIGMFTFGGVSLNMASITGILINLTGGVLYTLFKSTAK